MWNFSCFSRSHFWNCRGWGKMRKHRVCRLAWTEGAAWLRAVVEHGAGLQPGPSLWGCQLSARPCLPACIGAAMAVPAKPWGLGSSVHSGCWYPFCCGRSFVWLILLSQHRNVHMDCFCFLFLLSSLKPFLSLSLPEQTRCCALVLSSAC